MVLVFDLPLLHVRREPDVVMGRQEQARALALEPFADGGNLVRRGLLLGDQVVEPEDHQCIGVSQNAFVDGELVARLIDALKDGHGVAGGFTRELLEAQGGAVKQLQRTRNSLEKLSRAVFWRFVRRPQRVAHFGNRGEPVFHRRRIALRLPRIAPGPVDADTPLPRRVLPGDMVLIVGASRR